MSLCQCLLGMMYYIYIYIYRGDTNGFTSIYRYLNWGCVVWGRSFLGWLNMICLHNLSTFGTPKKIFWTWAILQKIAASRLLKYSSGLPTRLLLDCYWDEYGWILIGIYFGSWGYNGVYLVYLEGASHLVTSTHIELPYRLCIYVYMGRLYISLTWIKASHLP